MRIAHTLLTSLAALTIAVRAGAQTTVTTGVGDGGSPHDKTTWTIDGAKISIEYGRPSLKGRPEPTMMPAGQPWRTGADEATLITTDKPLTFGKVTLAPGTYTINTVPGDKGWTLLLGKLGKPGQWGIPYLPDLEIGRVPMTVSHGKSVEKVTILIDKAGGAPTLHVEWGTTTASTPFKIGA